MRRVFAAIGLVTLLGGGVAVAVEAASAGSSHAPPGAGLIHSDKAKGGQDEASIIGDPKPCRGPAPGAGCGKD